MKDKRINFFNTRIGNGAQVFVCFFAAMAVVRLVAQFVYPFKDFVKFMPSTLGFPMTMFGIMAVMMGVLCFLLALTISLGTEKYHAMCCIKGDDFPVPFYTKTSEFRANQPMFSPKDYMSDGKKYEPIWKNNFVWNDVLVIDKNYPGRLPAFESEATGLIYLVDFENINDMLSRMKNDKITGNFTFVRNGHAFTIKPVKA
jgi:hypothetical protein